MDYATGCGTVPAKVSSDAGVAGIGILLAFMFTAFFSLSISIFLVIREKTGKSGSSIFDTIGRRLLGSFSDQQLLMGIGLQSIGIARMSSMIPYHFFIIWMLSLLSIAVHNAAVIALKHDFRRDAVLRWIRQVLMAVNLLLSCTCGIFVLEAVQDGINNSNLPIMCAWSPNPLPVEAVEPPSKGVPLSFIGTIVAIAGNVFVFGFSTYYLQSCQQRYYRLIQVVGLVTMSAIAIGATIRVILLADAFGVNPVPGLGDHGERQWTFGQVLSVGMLALPFLAAIEIWRGEVSYLPPLADEQVKLLDTEEASAPEEGAELQETK